MNAGPLCAAAMSTALLAGCAGAWDRSYDRWYRYKAEPGPYGRWAFCIENRSYRYLDLNNQRPDEPAVEGTPGQLFTHVLADCRPHMSGPAWQQLSDSQVRRMIDDAHRAFERVGADIMDRDFHAIIETGTDARN